MSIQFVQGDLFKHSLHALVNPVNTVGVMGKGLALAFKKKFPSNFQCYEVACKYGQVQTGRMFVTGDKIENALERFRATGDYSPP